MPNRSTSSHIDLLDSLCEIGKPLDVVALENIEILPITDNQSVILSKNKNAPKKSGQQQEIKYGILVSLNDEKTIEEKQRVVVSVPKQDRDYDDREVARLARDNQATAKQIEAFAYQNITFIPKHDKLTVMEYLPYDITEALAECKTLGERFELVSRIFQTYKTQIEDNGFLHVDAKLEHIRLNEAGEIVFIDFGFSHFTDQNGHIKPGVSYFTTPIYREVEHLLSKKPTQTSDEPSRQLELITLAMQLLEYFKLSTLEGVAEPSPINPTQIDYKHKLILIDEEFVPDDLKEIRELLLKIIQYDFQDQAKPSNEIIRVSEDLKEAIKNSKRDTHPIIARPPVVHFYPDGFKRTAESTRVRILLNDSTGNIRGDIVIDLNNPKDLAEAIKTKKLNGLIDNKDFFSGRFGSNYQFNATSIKIEIQQGGKTVDLTDELKQPIQSAFITFANGDDSDIQEIHDALETAITTTFPQKQQAVSSNRPIAIEPAQPPSPLAASISPQHGIPASQPENNKTSSKPKPVYTTKKLFDRLGLRWGKKGHGYKLTGDKPEKKGALPRTKKEKNIKALHERAQHDSEEVRNEQQDSKDGPSQNGPRI